MSTHNICFRWEIRKISAFFGWKKRHICCYGIIRHVSIYFGTWISSQDCSIGQHNFVFIFPEKTRLEMSLDMFESSARHSIQIRYQPLGTVYNKMYMHFKCLFVCLLFNDTSTLASHFVSPSTERGIGLIYIPYSIKLPHCALQFFKITGKTCNKISTK